VIPWEGHTYLGTTDTDYTGPLDDPRCTDEDTRYLLDALNGVTDVGATPDEVVGSWAGLRPLLSSSHHARTADLSRRHAVHAAPSGLVTVTGGKLTTYRRMAADAVDAALGVLGVDGPPSPTRHLRLSGSDGVDPDVAHEDHLLGRYGSDTRKVRALVEADPDLAAPLVAGLHYLRAEAVYAARHEMAHTLDDVLTRRTRARVLDRDATSRAADAVADLLAPELRWDEERRNREVCEFRQALAADAP
jgi:glycerol-3-phosphate dehydrogenase